MACRNIIIGIHDLEIFRKILPDMVEWMKEMGEEVCATLLYVAPVLEAATPVLEEMKLRGIQLEDFALELERRGIRTQTKVRAGEFAGEVVREAGEKGAFAVLISTGGRARRSAHTWIVNEVIRRAPCPVVVFRPKLLKFTDRVAISLSSRIRKLTAKAATEHT